MAKKFILKNFAPGRPENGRERSVNNLFTLSSLGIKANTNLVKHSLGLGASQDADQIDLLGNFLDSEMRYRQYADFTNVNKDFIAFFDKSYPLRREYLRQFAQNSEIGFVLDTIADEAITCDESNYFAYLDLDRLKSNINASYPKSKELIECCESSFKKIYSLFGWDVSNDAWDYFRKFLIDGVLAFEIIYDYDHFTKQAKNIIAFKELDPVTLEPDVVKDEYGNEVKVWYQYRGDQSKQRVIPDSNVIYISWAKGNFAECSRVSYLEGLTRSFNMLRQLENSRIMWNIQNAQKRIKFVVPMGEMSPDRAKQRLAQMKATYNEDTIIDDRSGEITVNGLPKFSFTKTYMFPSVNGAQTEVSEMGVEGYDMNSTEQLKYFLKRFILETKVPAARFTLDPTSAQQNSFTGDTAVTREEYGFSRFIKRLQSIWKEILIKPTWAQVCLQMPELANSDYFYGFLGVKFYQENIFTLAKERSIAQEGANTVNTLMSIKDGEKPVFSTRFLLKKYLGMSDEDWKLNEEYKHGEKLEEIENTTDQSQQNGATDEGFGSGFGGGTDLGAGGDFGGGNDFGNDAGAGDFGEEAGGDTMTEPMEGGGDFS